MLPRLPLSPSARTPSPNPVGHLSIWVDGPSSSEQDAEQSLVVEPRTLHLSRPSRGTSVHVSQSTPFCMPLLLLVVMMMMMMMMTTTMTTMMKINIIIMCGCPPLLPGRWQHYHHHHYSIANIAGGPLLLAMVTNMNV